MAKRFQVIAVLFAWFLATGAQWDLVQVFGWSRMFASYSSTMSVGAALKETFSGEMCEVCHVVDEAKQQEKDGSLPPNSLKEKLLMIYQATPSLVLTVPTPDPWSLSDQLPVAALRQEPPTPPPRSA